MQMSVAATWALQTEYPTPFGGLIALLSSLTEMALPRIIPLNCITRYDHHSHVVLVTLVPLALMGVSVACAVMLARRGRASRCSRPHEAIQRQPLVTGAVLYLHRLHAPARRRRRHEEAVLSGLTTQESSVSRRVAWTRARRPTTRDAQRAVSHRRRGAAR